MKTIKSSGRVSAVRLGVLGLTLGLSGVANGETIGWVCDGGSLADLTQPSYDWIFQGTELDPFQVLANNPLTADHHIMEVAGDCQIPGPYTGTEGEPYVSTWRLSGLNAPIDIMGVTENAAIRHFYSACPQPPAGIPVGPVLAIANGINVTFSNLDISGGRGLRIGADASVGLMNVVVTDVTSIFVDNATLTLGSRFPTQTGGSGGSSVIGSCGGIAGLNGSRIELRHNSEVSGSQVFGVFVRDSDLVVGDSANVGSNAAGGIFANRSSVVLVGSPQIELNGQIPSTQSFWGEFNGGVNLHQSNLSTNGNPTIEGNYGNGILADLASVLRLSGVTVISNQAPGLFLRMGSIADLTPELNTGANAINVMNGNTSADIDCDSTAILGGDLSAVASNKCQTRVGDK